MIRLALADDHEIVRAGIRRLLADCPDIEVVGEAASGDEVMAVLGEREVDVLLTDVSMPGPGITELLGLIRETHPGVRILVLSMHPEEQYAVRLLKSGAVGYLMKNHSADQLTEAVRKVHRGGRYVSAALGEMLAFDLEPGAVANPHQTLSDREYEVLRLLGAGTAPKEIGARMAISPKTVSTYRSRILQKLNLRSTADIIRYAVDHGITI